MTRGISVVEAKKKFSELLARASYSGERFIIERRGKPMAALIGLNDLNQIEEKTTQKAEPQGLLAAAGALAGYEDFEEIMAEIYRSRQASKGRKVKLD